MILVFFERRFPLLKLTNLSIENINDCLALEVEQWQKDDVRPFSECLAFAYVTPETTIPLAIELENKAIGFLVIKLNADTKIIRLSDFMIDYRSQAKGFGTQALRELILFAESLTYFNRIEAFVTIGNGSAYHALEKAGFMRGAVDFDKRTNEMVYILQ